MRIARVFPAKTSMSPDDIDAYYDVPGLFTPHYDEVHISVTFTWDMQKIEHLKYGWRNHADIIKVGGCAVGDRGEDFVSGMYLKKGVTITSRGCPNNCSFCFVPKREGKLQELPIVRGNIIQDNNLTACSEIHKDNVFQMLKSQKGVMFRGGVESARVDDGFVERLRGISLTEVWLAYDHNNADKPLKIAVNKLSKYFKRDKIRCYVLIGYGQDTIEKAEIRLRRAWEIGTLPFAMLYRDDKNTPHTKEWKQFQRNWVRPAIVRSMMKGV